MASRTKLIILFLLVAISGWLFYQKIYLPKTTYSYIVAKQGIMKKRVFGIGEVSAKNLYPLCFNNGGRVQKITKEEGEWVKKGELIASLDPVDLKERLQAAQAALKKADFTLQSVKKAFPSLKAKEHLALLTFKRYQALFKQGFAAQAEFDKAKASYQSAKAELESAKMQIKAALAQKEEAAANVASIQEHIKRLNLYAPFDGVVVSKNAQIGQTLLPQSSVITLVRPKELWVKIYIDERQAGTLHKGAKASVVLRSRSMQQFIGYIARIEPKSDPVTEERIIDIAFAKPLNSFSIGEQAQATITTGIVKAVIVPSSVLTHGGVWVYRDGKAYFQKIKVVAQNSKKVAIEGVDEGTKILIPNPKKKPLFEGARVHL